MPTRTMNALSPLAALLIDWVITALWPLIGRVGVVYYSGVLFATAGLCVGALVVLPLMVAEHRWRPLLDRRILLRLAAMGFFSAMATVIYITALSYTTPANAAMMAQVEVLYSWLLCVTVLGERLTMAQTEASLLTLAGTSLIMFHDLGSPRWKGDLMILATPWMYQVSHMISKKLPHHMDPITLAGGRILFGIITMLPFCAWTLAHGGRWSWQPPALRILLVQGVLMSSVNLLLWYRAIRGMDLSKATAIMLSYPALTLTFSWALGRERISPIQVAGLAITMLGAYWMSHLVLEAQHHDPKPLPPETVGTDLVP